MEQQYKHPSYSPDYVRTGQVSYQQHHHTIYYLNICALDAINGFLKTKIKVVIP
jgi:hypothetical protein